MGNLSDLTKHGFKKLCEKTITKMLMCTFPVELQIDQS